MSVAIGQVQNLKHLLPVGMGIVMARTRTIFIDRTEVLIIQEGTRSGLQHVVIVLIDAKVPLDKDRWTDTKHFSESLNVILIENGTCRLAAIGTGAAINLFEDFFMKAMDRCIQAPGVSLLQGTQKFSILFGFVFRECPVSL